MSVDAAWLLHDGTLPDWASDVSLAVRDASGKVVEALTVAHRIGARLPQPGAGATGLRWALLALVAAQDLTVARVLEPHADALAILTEAGRVAEPGMWGVFAAEAPGCRLEATERGDRAVLDGTKPWCSLADRLDHALVTAHVDEERRLYAVDLRQDGVVPHSAERWVARGLSGVTSAGVDFHHVAAEPVGAQGWYLTRDGFAWGGIGVAACWFGGAYALYDALRDRAAQRADEIVLMQLGAVDVAIHASAATLRHAAQLIDSGAARGAAGVLLAERARAVVADAVERALTLVGHALGPAPLAFDERHARRVADLSLYVRQHHAERDLARLGARLVER